MISDRAIGRLREAAAWPALDARYEITGVAGHGGMGTVYEARDHVLDRDVAVKVLDVADQKGARAARLRREAHILARLDHPGIVPVHDAGALDDGRTFYVMKLLRGARLDDPRQASAPLAARLDTFSRILDAVAFAHAQGVVHRDLKPENVMIGRFGEVYVMDWGWRKTAATTPNASSSARLVSWRPSRRARKRSIIGRTSMRLAPCWGTLPPMGPGLARHRPQGERRRARRPLPERRGLCR